ncbi:MAG TPA: MFS transporter [Acetobacteraceae bacterium]|jgi:MFS family permease|nr:MFS transporter [Acetobacteraceae bacterium]
MKSGLLGAEPLSPVARKALIAGCIGFAIDFFDIYLPILALAPVTRIFQPPGLSSAATTTIYFSIFAATLLGRPVGAVIFGHWADRVGRRRMTMISIIGFGVFTCLIACLPGYGTIGMASLVLLILFRFIGGVFMGGEYTSNNTLALEVVPKERRGFVGGILQGAYPIGFFFVSVVTSILLGVTTPAEYVLWGWRIAFVFGAILAFLFLLYYLRVSESSLWMESEKSSAPLKDVTSGPNLKNLAQIFIMMLGFWFGSQSLIGVMPGVLIEQLHVPSRLMTNALLITSFIQFFAFVGLGLLGQMIGRRPAIVLSGVAILIGGTGLYAAAIAIGLSGGGLVMTTFIACLCYLLVVSPWGIVSTYICERFPTNVRASGYGIGYSLAVVIPAFNGAYMLALRGLMPYAYTPVVLIGLAGGLIIVGALMGPETRDVELSAVDVGMLGAAHAAGDY